MREKELMPFSCRLLQSKVFSGLVISVTIDLGMYVNVWALDVERLKGGNWECSGGN